MNADLARFSGGLAGWRGAAVFGVAIIALIWTGIGVKYLLGHAEDGRRAERASRNFAIAVEENVRRSIGEIDKSILLLRRAIELQQGMADFHRIIGTADVLSEIIVQVAIIDAAGIMRASNAGPQPAPPLDLSDREHYRAHLDSEADRLFISRPMVGRVSGQWSVQFTRRFLDRNGKFAGVIVASLSPTHLTEFYNRIELGATTSIALLGLDGIVRSVGGGSAGWRLGDDLGGSVVLERAGAAEAASFEAVDPVGGQLRLFSFRQVRGHPLLIGVGMDVAEVHQSSRAELRINCLAGLLLTFIVLGFMDRLGRTGSPMRGHPKAL